MYLRKKHYVKNWEHEKPEEKKTFAVLKGGIPMKEINLSRIYEITEEVGYWRKANAIHKWFVEKVQKGEDDCKEYYVSREQLQELLADVVVVLRARHLAPALLPTQEGFFFGSYDYDEWYWKDMEETKVLLEGLLAEQEGGEFYYHSSW